MSIWLTFCLALLPTLTVFLFSFRFGGKPARPATSSESSLPPTFIRPPMILGRRGPMMTGTGEPPRIADMPDSLAGVL